MEMKVYYNQIEKKNKNKNKGKETILPEGRNTLLIQRNKDQNQLGVLFRKTKKYKQEPSGPKYLKTNTHTEIRRKLTK